MHFIHHNGLAYVQFPALAALPGFFHGVFLKYDRKNKGADIALNAGLNNGDPDEKVWRNRRRMLSVFGSHIAVFAHQVHGNNVAIWRGLDDPRTTQGLKYVRLQGDALATAHEGSALVIQVADCQPVIIIDPVQRVVANVHSGWRGSIQNVVGRTVEALVADFACRPEHLICGIGPSLGPCCAEFVNYREEIPEHYWSYKRDANLFDFWQISIDQLRAAGVRFEHIHVARICTKCNQHLFFSYRGERKTGRFAAVVGIKASHAA